MEDNKQKKSIKSKKRAKEYREQGQFENRTIFWQRCHNTDSSGSGRSNFESVRKIWDCM